MGAQTQPIGKLNWAGLRASCAGRGNIKQQILNIFLTVFANINPHRALHATGVGPGLGPRALGLSP